MKVTQNNSPIQMDAYIKQIQQQRQQQDIQASNSRQQGTVDKVQLSAEAKAIHQSVLASGLDEEGRAEKVSRVKMDIEKGTYKVNATQVATDMLRETFENNKVLSRIDTRA